MSFTKTIFRILSLLVVAFPVAASDAIDGFISYDVAQMRINIDPTGYGIGIHKLDNFEKIVELVDKDNDGVIDLLRYAVLNQNGIKSFEVEDHEMDGVLDQRAVYENGKLMYFEIPFNGKWHKVIGNDGQNHILIEGQNIPVSYSDGVFKLNDS